MAKTSNKKFAMWVGGAALSIALFITIIVLIYKEDDGLVYVFELVRHGARAPLDSDGFNVPAGLLTPMGMR